ncbi:MAG: phosphoribosylanthranilate isomerase [Acidobacteria bacterium]|nr:phosphoribosylanthranilate isomerase [Acidobacteriota bacterium]
MHPTHRPRVKICCIGSIEEARLAMNHGASALGLVSEMPSGPGVIPESLIAAIADAAPPPIATFLLTSKLDAASIIAQQRCCRVNTVQICDRLAMSAYSELRAALPGVSLVQVIHVTGPGSVDQAISVAPLVDAVLLDSGNPSLPVRELGGTGRRHDWDLSREIRERLGVPVFLAGGLRPENVADAIERVGPFALDVCNGVRTEGALDETKLQAFFRAIG